MGCGHNPWQCNNDLVPTYKIDQTAFFKLYRVIMVEKIAQLIPKLKNKRQNIKSYFRSGWTFLGCLWL